MMIQSATASPASMIENNMSDAARLYEVVFKLVTDALPDLRVEHRKTLAQMITGVLRAGNVQFHQIARKLRDPGKKSSLINRFRRFVKNKNIKVDMMFLPFAEMILASLKDEEEITLIIDGSRVGGNCICLMLSVYYNGRALPLCWLAYKGKKGHSSSELQLQLLEMASDLLPEGKKITLLGDGEFDSAAVIKWLQEKENWSYVCRTATNVKVFYEGQWVALADLPLESSQDAFFTDLLFTESEQVGPVNIMAWWDEKEKKHFFLVTNMSSCSETQKWYSLRFTIETLFSDIKSRGFNLNKTRLRHTDRVERLIMVCAISYLFTISLGVDAVIGGLCEKLVRPADSWYDCYYSLFQIGLTYLDHLLNEYWAISARLTLYPPSKFHYGRVI